MDKEIIIMKRYKITERFELQKEFEKHFKLYFKDYFDVQTTIIFGYITIDLFKFDDFLHRAFGEYEAEQGKSMAQMVKEHFGVEAMKLIMRLI